MITIGDSVRLLDSRDTGKVLQIFPDGTVLVELSDGFEMTTHMNEIVPADHKPIKESKITQKKAVENIETLPAGWYIGIQPDNAQHAQIHLINHNNHILLFSWYQKVSSGFYGKLCGQIGAYGAQFLFSCVRNKIESELTGYFQFLPFYGNVVAEVSQLIDIPFKYPVKTLLRQPEKTPYAVTPWHLIKLKAPETQPNTITTHLVGDLEAQADKNNNSIKIFTEKVDVVVDLHIQALTPLWQQLTQDEILPIQIRHFEQCLERAIAAQMKEIIFIHGIGNGILKRELYRRLKAHPVVRGYEVPENSNLFGQGAVRVKL